MPRTIRFHLDEHVAHAVADGLRRLGIDVTTSTDANLLGASDAEQIAYGLAEGRIIFSQDDDLLALAAAGVRHAGLAYCHQTARSVGQKHPRSGTHLASLRAGRDEEPNRVHLTHRRFAASGGARIHFSQFDNRAAHSIFA
jgi:hypothetical protein